MENLSVIILVVSVVCAVAAQGTGSCFDTCSLGDTINNSSSCPVGNCTCDSSVMDYSESTCDPSCDIATYEVEFDANSSSCFTYFNDTSNWTFKTFSRNSSCNISEACCDPATIGDCFNDTGLNGTLTVTRDYRYASVIIEFGDTDSVVLRVGASLLLPCNGSGWLPNFKSCATYFGPANKTSNSCDQCGAGYNFGCFEFTLVNTSGCSDTPSSTLPVTTPMATPTVTPMAPPMATSMATPLASIGSPPTTSMTTGTSSGSNVTHSVGLTVILLVLLKLFCTTLQ